MVLNDLSSSLKDAVKKISGKSIVDEKAVKNICKDIQKALLQSDADVELVFDLTESIKKRALEEEPEKGLTQKEHVINIVYEELVKFLGEEEPDIPLKGGKILLLGLFGSGKCVHPETKIPLPCGDTKTAKEIYENCSKNEKEVDDGLVAEPEEEVKVYSMNPESLKIERRSVEKLWKLEKDESLMEITLNNGDEHSIKVTPEHPFFVLENGTVKKKRADEIDPEDTIAVPRKLPFQEGKIDLQEEYIKKLNESFYISNNRLAKDIREYLIEKYDQIKKAYEVLEPNFKYPWFTQLLKNEKKVPVQILRKLEEFDPGKYDISQFSFMREHSSNSEDLSAPKSMSKELGEFLGYIIGDGYLYDKYVEISNENPEIIQRFAHLGKKIFGLEGIVREDERKDNLKKVQFNSVALVEYLNQVFQIPIGAKSDRLQIPDLLLRSGTQRVSKFLRAYFDCDGHASEGTRSIELTTKSETLASELQTVLLRFGILASLNKKDVDGQNYHRLRIRGKDTKKFAEKIGSSLDYKEKALQKMIKIGNFQGSGKGDMLDVGQSLKKYRESKGVTVATVQNSVNSYGNYERSGRISRNSLNDALSTINKTDMEYLSLLKLLSTAEHTYAEIKEISNINHRRLNAVLSRLAEGEIISVDSNPKKSYKITQKGKNILSRAFDEKKFRELVNSDVAWITVAEVEEGGKSEYVYDFTVKDNHTFVADNFVVHNTTTVGKLAKFYKDRGLKTCLISCDTYRLAAHEQLSQIGERLDVPVYGDPEAEDSAKVLKDSLEKTENCDVVIVDSSGRDALNDEMRQEIKKLSDILDPEEKYLVIPADLGQQAGKQASKFQEELNITGVVVTKMDGTAKGGGALSACAATGAGVKFLGTGEKAEDLEKYDPERFVSRLIGYGDLESLLEKAQESEMSEEQAKKMMKGDFTMDDFYQQIEQMESMGSIDDIMDKMPGLGKSKIPDEVMNMQEEKMHRFKHIIDSMTPEEKQSPKVINASRKERIANGSGSTVEDVSELIKLYRQSKKAMKMFGGKGRRGMKGNLQQIMKKFGM